MGAYQRTIAIEGKNASEIYQAVSQSVEKFLSKTPAKNLKIDCDDSKKQIKVHSNLFSGTLICEDQAVMIDLSLGLMAMAFKGKLDEGIEAWLKRFQKKRD